MTSILFWGTEDSDFMPVGQVSVDQTAGRFSTLVDCGLAVPAVIGATSTGEPLCNFWRVFNQFTSNDFWITAEIWSNAQASIDIGADITTPFLFRFLDTNALPRLLLVPTGLPFGPTQSNIVGPWKFQTINAAGTRTDIGAVPGFTGPAHSTLERITFHIVYAVAGLIEVYLGGVDSGVLVYRFVGDTTVDGVTTLGGFDLGEPCITSGSPTGTTVWSSVAVGDFDIRSLELFKIRITGAGATSDWTGASDGSTVNEIVLNPNDGIDSATANQVELFTQPGSLPVGTYQIFGIGLNAYSSAAPGGTPQHMELSLRISGVDYFSPSLAEVPSLQRVAYFWSNSPASSTTFSFSEFGTMQIGVKSIA